VVSLGDCIPKRASAWHGDSTARLPVISTHKIIRPGLCALTGPFYTSLTDSLQPHLLIILTVSTAITSAPSRRSHCLLLNQSLSSKKLQHQTLPLKHYRRHGRYAQKQPRYLPITGPSASSSPLSLAFHLAHDRDHHRSIADTHCSIEEVAALVIDNG